MLSNFYWILENEIAGMALPTSAGAALYLQNPENAALEELRRETEDLRRRGVGAVVTLTEEPLDSQELTKAGLQYLHIPIPDMTAPTPSQILDFMQFARQNIDEGRPVVLHCFSGAGRTGTMIACYLVHKGRTANEAIRLVRRIRPGAIETLWQEEAVFEYEIQRSDSPPNENR
ncbi:MAG: dual specificity protein phosphatase family protein [Candidatus Omnitrophota bacterium]